MLVKIICAPHAVRLSLAKPVTDYICETRVVYVVLGVLYALLSARRFFNAFRIGCSVDVGLKFIGFCQFNLIRIYTVSNVSWCHWSQQSCCVDRWMLHENQWIVKCLSDRLRLKERQRHFHLVKALTWLKKKQFRFYGRQISAPFVSFAVDAACSEINP